MQIRSLGVTALVAACGSVALGQGDPPETELRYEVRRFDAGHNNGWTSSLNALPGDRIEVRALVSYVGTAPVIALGQIVYQPTIRYWAAGDTLLTNSHMGLSGTYYHPDGIGSSGSYLNTPPGGVTDVPGAYGRITPFAAAPVTGGSPPGTKYYRGHTHLIDGTSYLRIARSDVTNWFGIGPTSGGPAINNTNGAGGISSWQGSLGFSRAPGAPPPLIATQDILVFKFGFVLSTSPAGRELQVFTPPNGIGRYTNPDGYGGPGVSWFMSSGEIGPGSHRTEAMIVDATINVVPSPATLAIIGITCVMRRRKQA